MLLPHPFPQEPLLHCPMYEDCQAERNDSFVRGRQGEAASYRKITMTITVPSRSHPSYHHPCLFLAVHAQCIRRYVNAVTTCKAKKHVTFCIKTGQNSRPIHLNVSTASVRIHTACELGYQSNSEKSDKGESAPCSSI